MKKFVAHGISLQNDHLRPRWSDDGKCQLPAPSTVTVLKPALVLQYSPAHATCVHCLLYMYVDTRDIQIRKEQQPPGTQINRLSDPIKKVQARYRPSHTYTYDQSGTNILHN